MRLVRVGIAALIVGCSAGAKATTVVIMVEPMTLERHVQVYDTPGKDRILMCMAPPATSGCTDVTNRAKRAAV